MQVISSTRYPPMLFKGMAPMRNGMEPKLQFHTFTFLDQAHGIIIPCISRTSLGLPFISVFGALQ